MRSLPKILTLSALLLAAAGAGPCTTNVPIGGPIDGGSDGSNTLGDAAVSADGQVGDTCQSAGGTCIISGGSCSGGHIGDQGTYPCGESNTQCCLPDASPSTTCNLGNDPLPCTNSSTCGPYGGTCDHMADVCRCITQNCTPTQDETCNADPGMNAFAGHCNSAGACECKPSFVKEPVTGHCRHANSGEPCNSGGNAALPDCAPGLSCEPGPQPGTGSCIGPSCPATQPSSGSGCVAPGLSCSYLPNITCTCSGSSTWQCVP